MDTLTVSQERATEPGVQALLLRHHALMRATSPAESCHVMRPDALDEAGAFILAAREDEAILGIGALVKIGSAQGELKSMHTAEEARGRGVARTLLDALLNHAKEIGFTQVSLETGSQAPFAAARALYTSAGFSQCPPFGDYIDDPLSVFMSRNL